jgi:hypothetical protein
MLLKLATQTQMKNRTAAVMASISVSVNFGRLSIARPVCVSLQSSLSGLGTDVEGDFQGLPRRRINGAQDPLRPGVRLRELSELLLLRLSSEARLTNANN